MEEYKEDQNDIGVCFARLSVIPRQFQVAKNGWMDKLHGKQTIESYLDLKRNQILTYIIVWMGLEDIILTEWPSLFEASWAVGSADTESRTMATRDQWGEGL